jgi:serine/threonine protein kinase
MGTPRDDSNVLEGEVAKYFTLSDGGVLGTGNFSVVRRATDIRTGHRRAIKIIDMRKYYKGVSTVRTDQEVEILRSVSHPNIVQIFDVFTSKNFCYIVLELAEGGELLQSVMEHEKYSEGNVCFVLKTFSVFLLTLFFLSLSFKDDARCVFRQILGAVKHLHAEGIVHRDLKVSFVCLYCLFLSFFFAD